MEISVLQAGREVPDAPAIIAADRTITFGELADRVARCMAWLSAQGLGEGDRIGVVVPLRAETIIVLFALFELGITAVLVHPRLGASERSVLAAEVPVALTLGEDFDDAELPAAPLPPPRTHDPEQPMLVAFTSGTSGVPKGVVISRRALVASALASAKNLGWYDGDRWLISMPLAHVGGISIPMRCLLARRPVVLQPWAEPAVFEAIESREVTLVSLVPTMLQHVLDAGYRFPARVRAVLLGGDHAPARLLDRARELDVPALTTYGLTETCSQIATQRPGEPPSPSAGVGHPLHGVAVRIAEDGEILVRSPTLASAYLARGRREPIGEWFATGDLGTVDDTGRLFVHGRKKDLIITGGENVNPVEVEDALRTCPGLREAVVFGVKDERWGEIVAAVLVGDTGDRERLARHMAARLAPHKRPRLVHFADSVPHSAPTKVARARVAAQVRELLEPMAYPRGEPVPLREKK